MVKLYFATNRDIVNEKEGKFGERFHHDGPQFYRVGVAKLKVASNDKDNGYEIQSVEIEPEGEKGDKPTGDAKARGSTRIFSELRQQMEQDKRDILIYIHGFANTFESSLQRAAQIKQNYLIQPKDGDNSGEPYEPYMFLFSWPTNGRIEPPWEYTSDREDGALSGIAIARALKRFLDFLEQQKKPCEQRIHLVAHSMGNWALRHALLGIRSLSGEARLTKIFEHAFLMAADEDDDALEDENKLGLLPQLARAIHVYHGTDDRVLVISDVTKFNPDRLGADGPRTFSGLSSRITAIDCSKVNSTELFHGRHQYYRLRGEVIADVRHVLAGTLRPDEIPTRDVIEQGRRYRIDPKKGKKAAHDLEVKVQPHT